MSPDTESRRKNSASLRTVRSSRDYEIYHAVADQRAARTLADTASPFTIEVRFLGGLTTSQRAAFKAAADRWTSIIVGDLPSVQVEGEVIDDVLILAQGTPIDGPGKILGQAGPTHLRPRTVGASAFLPARGIMSFDTADLKAMEQRGTIKDVITHEMGHVLGFGTVWELRNQLKGMGTANPTFAGTNAKREYRSLRGSGGLRRVPLENTGGPGTAESHWRETIFRSELMSGFIAAPGNPLSRLTAASLADIGYTVDMGAAEEFVLPDLMALAESGILVARAIADTGVILPIIPMILPEDSVQ